MIPPKAPVTGISAQVAPAPSAVSSCLTGGTAALQTLTRRPDFLRAARARRQVARGFVLQARKRHPGEGETAPGPAVIRIGFTCSKKVGNAVARNRAKRRLRAIARAVLPEAGRPGWDYVLIGRREATATLPYLELLADLRYGLGKIHGSRP